jgi:hypothetical protein
MHERDENANLNQKTRWEVAIWEDNIEMGLEEIGCE